MNYDRVEITLSHSQFDDVYLYLGFIWARGDTTRSMASADLVWDAFRYTGVVFPE